MECEGSHINTCHSEMGTESCTDLGILLDEDCVWSNLEQPQLKGLVSSGSRHSEGHHRHHWKNALRDESRARGKLTQDAKMSCVALGGSGMLPMPLVLTKLWRCPVRLLRRLCRILLLATTA